MTAALEIENAVVPDRLNVPHLRVDAGRLLGLLGPNGSGKSTLLQVAAGLQPVGGEVRWQEEKLSSIPIIARGRRATWVPQDARFEFGFTVRAVVAQGRFAHGDDRRGIDEALARLDLTGLAGRPVTQLSGGERARVMLARAVVTAAPLHLWDEPLAALDVRHGLEVWQLARELTRTGATVMLSLHDLRHAHLLDAAVVLHSGSVRAQGAPNDVLTPTLVREVFGVQMRTAPGMILELP